MKTKPALNTEHLRARLKLKTLTAKTVLLAHHPHIARLLTSGALASALLLSPGQPISHAALPESSLSLVSPFDLRASLSSQLQAVLPTPVGPLTPDQETKISTLLHQIYGVHAMAELEGNRLNQSYGLIGAEQHLMRYPGDSVENMAPGRGAWGYFAPSKDQLTPDLIEKERYYAVVQTLYLPDWTTRLAYLRDWYKYRKVLIANPVNGKVIIADIADSGPAAWTGKHFGGSPEVMAYLGLNIGKQKGPVILFFIDDPDDKIPLGPLEYNLEKGPPLLSHD